MTIEELNNILRDESRILAINVINGFMMIDLKECRQDFDNHLPREENFVCEEGFDVKEDKSRDILEILQNMSKQLDESPWWMLKKK